jgi:signal-transduction protein with cAMP-binding, CBS, and nucleotidyltransferase domain
MKFNSLNKEQINKGEVRMSTAIDFSMVDALKADAFIQLLSKDDFDRFQSCLLKKTVAKGEILIKEGQPQTEAFIIESGKIQKSRQHGGLFDCYFVVTVFRNLSYFCWGNCWASSLGKF